MNKKLKELLAKWEYEFKADLIEGISKHNIKSFLQTVVGEYMPIWLENAEEDKDTERIELYNYFKVEFKKVIGA